MPIGATSGGYNLFVAKETTWGTAPAGAAFMFLPAEPLSGLDVIEAITDDLRRGQNIIGYNRMEGIHRTELSVSTLSYPEQMGLFLYSILGKDTVAGTAAPYTHVFDAISDTPSTATPSMSIVVKDDILTGSNLMIHEGLKCTGLTQRFTVAEGFLTVEASFIGKGARLGGIASMPTSESATNDPFRGWEACVTNASGELDGKVIDAEITIAREADAIYAACSSTADPNNKYADNVIHGMVGITGRVTATFDNVNLATLYRSFGSGQLLVRFNNNLAGGSLRSLEYDIKKATFSEAPAEIDRSGNHMTIAFSFRGLYDATSTKGIVATLKNGKASY